MSLTKQEQFQAIEPYLGKLQNDSLELYFVALIQFQDEIIGNNPKCPNCKVLGYKEYFCENFVHNFENEQMSSPLDFYLYNKDLTDSIFKQELVEEFLLAQNFHECNYPIESDFYKLQKECHNNHPKREPEDNSFFGRLWDLYFCESYTDKNFLANGSYYEMESRFQYIKNILNDIKEFFLNKIYKYEKYKIIIEKRPENLKDYESKIDPKYFIGTATNEYIFLFPKFEEDLLLKNNFSSIIFKFNN